MKPTPMRAWLWLFWRWTRWHLVGMCAIFAASVLVWRGMEAFLSLTESRPDSGYPGWFGGIGMLLLLWAWVVAIFWPTNATEGAPVFAPERLLRLPVKTWQLAVGYIVPGVTFVIVLTWGIWAVAYSVAAPGMPFILSQFLELGAWGLMLTALAQSWLLVFGIHHGRLGMAVLVGLGLVGVRVLGDADGPNAFLAEHSNSVCLGVAFVAYGIAIVTLAINRSGGFGNFSVTGLERLAKFEFSSTPARRFRDAAEAQRWYEWRRIGWHLPALSFTFVFVYYGLVPGLIWAFDAIPDEFDEFYASWVTGRDAFNRALFVGLVCPTVLAGISSLGIDFTEHFGKRRTFYFTRPEGTAFLVRSRYAAIAKNVLLTGIPLFAMLWYFPDTREGLLRFMTRGFDYEQPTALSTAVGIGFVLAGIWALYWPLNMVLLGIVSSLIVPSLVVLDIAHHSGNLLHEWYGDQFVLWSCVAVGCVLIGLLARLVRRGLRSKAFAVGHVSIAAAIWAAVVIAMVWYVRYGSVFSTGELERYEWAIAMVLPLSWSLLPAVAVITAPYLLHEARHRR